MFKINWVRDPHSLILKKPNLKTKEITPEEKSLIEILREEKLNKSQSNSRSLLKSASSKNNYSPGKKDMQLVPLLDKTKNGSDQIFYERSEDRILAIRKNIEHSSSNKAIVFNEHNRVKTDYELKNDTYKKIDAEGVLKHWEFKAKAKYSSKFLLAFKTNL